MTIRYNALTRRQTLAMLASVPLGMAATSAFAQNAANFRIASVNAPTALSNTLAEETGNRIMERTEGRVTLRKSFRAPSLEQQLTPSYVWNRSRYCYSLLKRFQAPLPENLVVVLVLGVWTIHQTFFGSDTDCRVWTDRHADMK